MRSFAALLLLLLPQVASAEVPLVCAHQIFEKVGETVWPGWSKAPFSTLLIDGEQEYLFSKNTTVKGFSAAERPGPDGFTTLQRARTFDRNLLATFPVFSAEPVIVVGTPAATGKSDGAWATIVLHEHFHQFQYSQPWYYKRAAELNLAKGDTTGMWMLNYPFPYADANVQARYAAFSKALADALGSRGGSGFGEALRVAQAQWRELRTALKPDDYRYMQFQMWQEGGARYAEIMAATEAAKRNLTCAGMIAPIDIAKELAQADLARDKRVAFYSAGAAVAMLLDVSNPGWKTQYFAKPFEPDALF